MNSEFFDPYDNGESARNDDIHGSTDKQDSTLADNFGSDESGEYDAEDFDDEEYGEPAVSESGINKFESFRLDFRSFLLNRYVLGGIAFCVMATVLSVASVMNQNTGSEGQQVIYSENPKLSQAIQFQQQIENEIKRKLLASSNDPQGSGIGVIEKLISTEALRVSDRIREQTNDDLDPINYRQLPEVVAYNNLIKANELIRVGAANIGTKNGKFPSPLMKQMEHIDLTPTEMMALGEMRAAIIIKSLQQRQQQYSLRDISTDANTKFTNWKNALAKVVSIKGYTRAGRYIESTDPIGRSALQIPVGVTNRTNRYNNNLQQQQQKAPTEVPAPQGDSNVDNADSQAPKTQQPASKSKPAKASKGAKSSAKSSSSKPQKQATSVKVKRSEVVEQPIGYNNANADDSNTNNNNLDENTNENADENNGLTSEGSARSDSDNESGSSSGESTYMVNPMFPY